MAAAERTLNVLVQVRSACSGSLQVDSRQRRGCESDVRGDLGIELAPVHDTHAVGPERIAIARAGARGVVVPEALGERELRARLRVAAPRRDSPGMSPAPWRRGSSPRSTCPAAPSRGCPRACRASSALPLTAARFPASRCASAPRRHAHRACPPPAGAWCRGFHPRRISGW